MENDNKNRKPRRPRRKREPKLYEERVVNINRVTKVVKGGRRFGFSALVVVGNQAGKIGIAHAKAKQVPDAIKKAIDIKADLPKELMFVMDEKENYDIIDNNVEKVKQHIKERI